MAHIFFHGRLQDFLPKHQRQKWFNYSFTGAPALKDALEALGVPHPEIGSILLEGQPAAFLDSLPRGARVEAYPIVCEESYERLPPLQIKSPVPACFVLDVHLGKLARYLRLLGFDTLYENHYDDQTIAQLAAKEQRIVLTRDIGLLKQKVVVWGYWLRSQHLETQLAEVMKRFGLKSQTQPFTRCMACNGSIAEVPKESILPLLQPKTKAYFQEFYQCPICQRVYWKGSHYDKMQGFLERL
ncbi:Mut7-C ubiquitin/RNAse domain-containing protein [Rufibacter aurantiacus]|uniref:Mut7-C ubiquitin/RNAse domain-containing protein n=1 Tax=Rufibacter aurantiacus TaxID=2817374 RepID=UPI001FED90FB|nr:Mut7-C ubiquitin/RNAse domain-containing protein [Rufibacter aurantiacus]